MNKEGEISAMPPVYSDTSEKIQKLFIQLNIGRKKTKAEKFTNLRAASSCRTARFARRMLVG
jgi:hypothetical protein